MNQSFRLDTTGRTPAYFSQDDPVIVDTELIAHLKKSAKEFGNKNTRICLHSDAKDTFHQMITLEHSAMYYRPHRHKRKSESFHIIEGSMAVFRFSDNGNIEGVNVLDAHNFIYRICSGVIHSVMPLTAIVIYHEAKPGPFTGQSDSVYPVWSAENDDDEGIRKYKDRVRRFLDEA